MGIESLAFALTVLHLGLANSEAFGTAADLSGKVAQESISSKYMQAVLQGYFTNEKLGEHMRDYSSSRCANISRIFSLGESAKGVPLLVLEISDKPGIAEPKPHFKYVGNMHGDEPTGRVLQLAFAEWLCSNWENDPAARRIVTGMKLFLLPTINPDGFALRQRGNSANMDLNRDFPDPFRLGREPQKLLQPQGTEQPETLAIMKWSSSTQFVASASMHEFEMLCKGAFVANYPWDGSSDGGTHYSAAPDDKTFVHLAKSYASLHGKMNVSSEFKEGITNGAAWYPLWGGMQDWNYLAAKCMELTLELSQNKWPPPETLSSVWEDNRLAMTNLPLTAAFGGLRGFVKGPGLLKPGHRKQNMEGSSGNEQPIPAKISVAGIDFNISASVEFGDYYRPLAPGKYTVLVQHPGYSPQAVDVTIPEDGSGVQHNFTLTPASGKAAGAIRAAALQLPRKLGKLPGSDGKSKGDSSVQAKFRKQAESSS